MKRIVDGEDYIVPPTFDDPSILDEIKQKILTR
jgi:hypothetical protein